MTRDEFIKKYMGGDGAAGVSRLTADTAASLLQYIADNPARYSRLGGSFAAHDALKLFVLNSARDTDAAKPKEVTLLERKRARDTHYGTHTELTLSNGKVVKIQRMDGITTMGLPGWHELDTGHVHSAYLADTEAVAIKAVLNRANGKPY